jgi:hypothetical protein
VLIAVVDRMVLVIFLAFVDMNQEDLITISE